MDGLGSLSAFVHAAELRSFTAAANQLGISASAVGKAVARLEERLQVRLLHRSTRKITLTGEGALFLERCRRILAEVEAAELELSQTIERPRGKLKVSMPIVSMLMMPAILRFMDLYPEIELDLDFSDRLVDVIDEGFDAVVRAGNLADSRLMSRMLGQFSLILVAAPQYLERAGTPRVPDDLMRHDCLHHRYATSGKLEPWPLQEGETELRPDLPTTAVVNTIEPLIMMAERGMGIASLPDFAIADQLATGRLVAVLPDFVRHEGSFRLLWPTNRHIAPKLRVFVDFMAANLFPVSPQREPTAA
ncbi:LysR family transcriptional regulator [Neoaquamicrobium sediminum]|uniref:LysR family transcriptional regulator n=1 Tax=Neoaquamicrobium sediminum TaxID=1849104 RepID=UPI001566FF5E|nr:LysR family transcriptional regulator [Mesorhizobium sediminum]NRC56365.1 LysR family transcriptional regulator [Mesorhizobium sediminum]